ncbi:MAG: helix-turn-helix transcriptional regulator [Pseudomonadota bacterium]
MSAMIEEKRHFVSSEMRRSLEIPSANIRDAVHVLYDLTPLNSELNTGVHQNRAWHAETCFFAQVESDPFAVRRRKSQAESAGHLVSVHRFVSGHFRGRIGDQNIDRDSGPVYLFDMASLSEGVQTQSVLQSIFIPKFLLGYDPDRHLPLIKFETALPMGALLAMLHKQMFEDLARDNSYSPEDYDQFIACLQLALGTAPPEGDVRRHARAAMRRMICSFVEGNLEDWDLSVQAILRRFGISRASLFRMFQSDGGVRQYISDRRLLRAVMDMTNGPIKRGDIASTAERWGFSSAPSFNRAVRQKFGVPPGGLLQIPVKQTSLRNRFQSVVGGKPSGTIISPSAYSAFSARKVSQLAAGSQMMPA